LRVTLARCRDLLGQQEEAEKILDDVLARQPDFPPALAERGKLAMREGQMADAERFLREAADSPPADYQLHYRLYQCLVQNGKTEEAREEQELMKRLEADLRRINEIMSRQMQQTPHDAALHCEVGMLTLRSGTPQEAVRWFQSALKEDPDYAPAHEALADYYQQIGNPPSGVGRARGRRPSSGRQGQTLKGRHSARLSRKGREKYGQRRRNRRVS
jgi:Flp pilus assembly protein TadD